MKIYVQVLTSSIKPQIWSFHDGKEIDKNEKRTCRSCKASVFRPLNMQICDVLVAVDIVVAKAPCCFAEEGTEMYKDL